jgi:hypothetical protein
LRHSVRASNPRRTAPFSRRTQAAGIFTYLDTAGNVRKVNILTATGLAADPTALGIIKLIPTGDKINNNRVGDSTATLLRNTGGYSFKPAQ